MRDSELIRDVLHQILGATQTIAKRFAPIHSPTDFLSSDEGMEKLDAICMQLIAIGESIKHLDRVTDGSLLPNYPGVEWKRVMGMRDVLSHHYFDIDAEVVYTVCRNHLPVLSVEIARMLDDIAGQNYAAYIIETFERSQAALINLEEYRQFRQYMAEREAFFQQLEETEARNAARNRGLSADLVILEELEGFGDTHSRAEPANSMELVEVALDSSTSIVYCPVAKDLLSRVRTQAQQQGVSVETLVNLWLQEKLGASE